jgi:SAM-dependent methyltransferase
MPGHRSALQFVMAHLERLPLPDGSVDLAASDAVFEHCRDLRAVLAETRRVLRPGGLVYATYGPLWYCFGGDHFSGRGGPSHGYEHLEAEPGAYRRYFERHLTDDEDAQDGGRYVELDLFSKLTTRQYFALYEEAGLELVDSVLEVSAQALAFRRAWPDRFRSIRAAHSLHEDDLLIKTHLVILRRPERSR